MWSPDGLDSFEAFVRTRTGGFLRYGYVLTGSQHDAADLVQEALVRLGVGWERVRGKGDPERYVRTTMARLHVIADWWAAPASGASWGRREGMARWCRTWTARTTWPSETVR